jgi:hypothetical protein
VTVEIDAEVLNFLIQRAQWLSEAEAEDVAKIGGALSKGLKLSSTRS